MPFVCECDDSHLSDVTTFPLADEDVAAALDAAEGGDVAEGCVGAGTGTQCMDFSRAVSALVADDPERVDRGRARPDELGERELLRIDGVPVGRDHRPDAGATHRGFRDRGRRDRRADGPAPAPSPGGSRRARARAMRLDRPQRVGRADARVLDGQPDPAGVRGWDGRRAGGARRSGRILPDVFNELRGDDRGGRGGGCSPPRRPSGATETSCTRCRSSAPWRSSPATDVGPASRPITRSGWPRRTYPTATPTRSGTAPPRDRAVAELHDDQAVVLAIAAVGVLAHPDVLVHDEVMPVQVHRGGSSPPKKAYSSARPRTAARPAAPCRPRRR